jgi:uncharacterized membrane protein
MSLFLIVKFLHVLLAIVAVGTNATYGIWVARVAKSPPAVQSHVLRGIKTLDDWFANPAYILLAVTGLAMVILSGGSLALNTFWVAAGIVLWALAVILGFFVYTPALRQQIRALETSGPETDDYRSAANNARFIGIVVGAVVVVIVFVMVTKPAP